MRELGEKIKALRLQNQMTLTELSQKAKVSTGVLSQIERGLSAPTVTTLDKISTTLGVTMSELFSDDGPSVKAASFVSERVAPKSKYFAVVRKDDRKKISMPWGASFEMLSQDLQHKIEFIILHYPVGCQVGDAYSHEGEECGLVLEGKFRGTIGEEEVILEPGDSVYYDSCIPHRWENAGDTDVKAIWVINPPWL